MRKLIGIVSEGPTDYMILKSVIWKRMERCMALVQGNRICKNADGRHSAKHGRSCDTDGRGCNQEREGSSLLL